MPSVFRVVGLPRPSSRGQSLTLDFHHAQPSPKESIQILWVRWYTTPKSVQENVLDTEKFRMYISLFIISSDFIYFTQFRALKPKKILKSALQRILNLIFKGRRYLRFFEIVFDPKLHCLFFFCLSFIPWFFHLSCYNFHLPFKNKSFGQTHVKICGSVVSLSYFSCRNIFCLVASPLHQNHALSTGSGLGQVRD